MLPTIRASLGGDLSGCDAQFNLCSAPVSCPSLASKKKNRKNERKKEKRKSQPIVDRFWLKAEPQKEDGVKRERESVCNITETEKTRGRVEVCLLRETRAVPGAL